MMNCDVTITVAILAVIRGDLSTRCVADRFGVTEALVNEWKDVFMVAGALALYEHGRQSRRQSKGPRLAEELAGATTFPPDGGLAGATTTPEPAMVSEVTASGRASQQRARSSRK